jgi:hypothetical protein
VTAARPIWITEDEMKTRWADATLRERWFAAPADATEAVLRAMWPDGWIDPEDAHYREAALLNARAVLAALSYPGSADEHP